MRIEYKYLIPVTKFDKIKREMLPYLLLNKYAAQRENKEYTVRSIYFDTLQWKYYYEKIEGVKVRKKLRIRGYDEYSKNSIVYLEVKRKYDNFSNKSRSPVLYNDLSRFFEIGEVGDYSVTCDSIIRALSQVKNFLFHFVSDGLRPTTLVTYEREAYDYKFDRCLKITFDKNLRFLPFVSVNDLYEEENLMFAFRGYIIVEIKFTHPFPVWLQDIVSRHGLQRMALSKYTICRNKDNQLNPVNSYKKFAISNSFPSSITTGV